LQGAQRDVASRSGADSGIGQDRTALRRSSRGPLSVGLCARRYFRDVPQTMVDRRVVRARLQWRRYATRGRLWACDVGFLMVAERSHSGGPLLQVSRLEEEARLSDSAQRP